MAESLLLLTCLLCVSLKKSYRHLSANPPEQEQKRVSHQLRLALKHTPFLALTLDTVLVAAFALFAADVAFSFELIWSFLILFVALALIFLVLPRTAPTRPEDKLAIFLSRPAAFFLSRLEKPASSIENLLARTESKFRRVEPLDKKAVKAILEEQKEIADENFRLDLQQAISGLEFSKNKARHFMTNKKKVRFVSADEKVGPILLSELHDTNRRIFPVQDGSEIIGTVRLDGLTMLKAGGNVSEALDPQMVVVNKNDSAMAVINRFNESAAELVFAEGETGEVEGVVYLEDVLDSLA